jgi:hypothetical protein
MLALTAALYGAPSGGYYTGAYAIDEETGAAIPLEMKPETIALKVKSTTPETPLLVLSQGIADGAGTLVISGENPERDGGRYVPANSVDMAVTYFCTPFKLRRYKRTPLASYTEDAVIAFRKQVQSFARKYIATANMSPKRLENFIREGFNLS